MTNVKWEKKLQAIVSPSIQQALISIVDGKREPETLRIYVTYTAYSDTASI